MAVSPGLGIALQTALGPNGAEVARALNLCLEQFEAIHAIKEVVEKLDERVQHAEVRIQQTEREAVRCMQNFFDSTQKLKEIDERLQLVEELAHSPHEKHSEIEDAEELFNAMVVDCPHENNTELPESIDISMDFPTEQGPSDDEEDSTELE